ncbi:uncharacterized protein LOC110875156 [Helianthus annuus]|uniref:uncharacterized protein LOC110875156 n=1 Tax=Helianthus annuus TaxID=4232 RepID=UPI000B9025DB|nr:uncharacterized protein LOC110875156 [Helianthus annuus]
MVSPRLAHQPVQPESGCCPSLKIKLVSYLVNSIFNLPNTGLAEEVIIRELTYKDTKLDGEAEENRKESDERAKAHQSLYEAALSQKFEEVYSILEDGKVSVTEKIAINGNTTLHLVIGITKKKEVLEKMLELVPERSTLLGMQNSDGSTLLHVAAIVGNIEAAKILVQRNQDLLFIKDKEGHTPLARALSNMHTDTYLYLLNPTHDIEMATLFTGISGDELLVNAISSKDYHAALKLSDHYRSFHSDATLMAIAQNFPRELNIWERVVDRSSLMNLLLLLLLLYLGGFNAPEDLLTLIGLAYALHIKFVKEEAEMHNVATRLLKAICELIKRSTATRFHSDYYNNAILEATRQNADKVVRVIVSFFPNAIWSANEEGHNIIQYAVINHSEKVYNLLYQMSEHKNIYRTIKDTFGNNLLHLAAKLAPPDKLNHISGAALQLQRELQWFKVAIFGT